MNSKILKLLGLIYSIFFILYLFTMNLYINVPIGKLISLYLGSGDYIFEQMERTTYALILLLVLILIFVTSYNCLELQLNRVIIFGLSSSTIGVVLVIYPFIRFSFYTNDLPYTDFIIALIFQLLLFLITSIPIWFKYHTNYKEEAHIRKTILDIGIQYPDFTLREIAKECSTDKNTILKVANTMIRNKEIYAKYFYGTEKFAFNKKANIEEIDKLMELFNTWETEHTSKKK